MDWTADINLERAILTKIAGLLWRHVLATFLKDFSISAEYWGFLEDKCVESIGKLPLLKALGEKLKKIIKPIGLEILTFTYNCIGIMDGRDCLKPIPIYIYKGIGNIDINSGLKRIPVNIVWTVRGTVDNRQTFKVLIDGESLDLKIRYRLACLCCSEKRIAILWEQMSVEQKSDVLDSKCGLENIWSLQKSNPEALIEKANEAGFSCINEYAFISCFNEFALLNKVGVEFFWKKLPFEVRRTALRKAMRLFSDHISYCGIRSVSFNHVCKCSEIMFFLFSQADKEFLILMEDFNISAITLFLDWPYQENIINILDSGHWTENFLCLDVLHKLVNKILCDFQDYDYKLLLKLVVRQVINFHKQWQGLLLFNLRVCSRFCNDELCFIISRCKNVLKKEVIIGRNIFESLSSVFVSLSDDEGWDFITFIIDECILKSQNEIFRKDLKKATRRISYECLRLSKLTQKVVQFLLDIIVCNVVKKPKYN